MATSISVNDIFPGRLIRCRNRLLPTPAVPVIVPALLTAVPATSANGKIWVSDKAFGTPIIVIFPTAVDKLMFAPATSVLCAGPEIVILCAPAPTLTPPAPEILSRLVCVPEELAVVFPRAVIDTVAVCTEAEIVIVEFACPIPIPAPAEIDMELDDPFRTKLVANGAEILTDPFPAPTLMAPMPENANTLLNVPEEVAPVVFPEAESETVENAAPAAGAEILTVPFPAPTLIAPIPEKAKTLLNVPEDVAPVVLPDADNETVEKLTGVGPTMVMEFTPVFRVMLFPAAKTMVPVEVAAPVPSAAT